MMGEAIMYVVRYEGPFGFIKPWTAVRDGTTFSQAFLTPSIVEGMRQKLEVSNILRHRLRHRGVDPQQERTQSAGWIVGKKQATRSLSILIRGVLLQPELYLAFQTLVDAETAIQQHICLCRNEDVLLPFGVVESMSEVEFDALPGIELLFGQDAPDAFLVGYNRFADAEPMYGRLLIVHPDDNDDEG